MTQDTARVAHFDDAVYEEQCEIASFWTGSRLIVLASVFLYGTFAFAYFYLRALNSHGDWRVGNQHPSTIIGTAVVLCVVLASVVHYSGARRLQYGAQFDWFVASVVSLILLIVGAGLQIWDLTRLPFFPASSGYTSVFVAWMPVFILYILGTFYWLETLVAQSLARPHTVTVWNDDDQLLVPHFGAKVEGFIAFTLFMSVASILIWILFYIL